MVNPLSPGIQIKEYNSTTSVPSVATTSAGLVGKFNWGPVDDIMTVSDENVLLTKVTEPDSNTYVYFFMAANFLSYGNDLKLIRSGAAGLKNASANGSGLLIKNETDYTQNYSSGANTYGMFAAKWAGDKGNSLKVSVYASANTQNFNNWIYNGYFQAAPNTSTYATNVNGANDELHIVVVDEDGKFSGTANTVLEAFGFLSKASDAQNSDGSTNYYKDVINQRSQYIWWLSHPDAGLGWANTTSWGQPAAGVTFGAGDNHDYTISLTNGVYASSVDANTMISQALFKNKDILDVSFLIGADYSSTVLTDLIQNVAEYRQDALVTISPQMNDVVNNSGQEATAVVATRNSLPSSSYAIMDSGWKYQYDKYNDTYRWLPLSADIAGVCVRTDLNRDPWWSPAGYNRGQINNVVKLAWNPNQTDRDTLYKNGVNPVVNFLGQGPILYGDKTMLSRPSAFDRINVRRLFIVLEKQIGEASKSSLFEFNDSFTRAQFVALIEPFLRDVQGRRGIQDFKVVCDETNNTPTVIMANQFVGDIYIKPNYSINYIRLNFVAVGPNLDFNEVIGKFGE